MVLVETSIFTRQVQALFSDEEYRQLQMALVLHPDLGAVIPGSSGLRKVRWTIRDVGNAAAFGSFIIGLLCTTES